MVGLIPLVRTTPEPQSGALFGLDTVQWDGQILTGAAGIDGVAPYSPPVSVDLGAGLPAVRAVCFADPDGATLELIEQRS